jgi:LPS sulfotransferase NodH
MLAPVARPSLSYVICTGPRTGSSLLCAALWRTGSAGRPAEYFDIHAHNEAHWQKEFAIRDEADYLDKVLAAGTTANGVFGFKLHWHQSPALIAKLIAHGGKTGLPDRPGNDLPTARGVAHMDALLRSQLGEMRYIWLRRKNKVAQAISYFRASKTDQWRVPAAGAAPVETAPPIEFDYDAIHKHVLDVERFDRGWYEFFMRDRLRALIVVYEDFIQNYEKTVHGVLGYLGVDDPRLALSPPHYRQQADNVSAEWERRYRETRAGSNSGPHPAPAQPKRLRATAGRRKRSVPAAEAAGEVPLIAYDLGSGINLPIEPAQPTRPWMDATPKRFVYRCLPLVIANQAGWFIRNSHRLTATWDGTPGIEGVRVAYDTPCANHYASSHFGSGILTFSVGCLFRTPPGYNLHVRGPANWPKDGICALEGIVETDWNRATFTMNWKFTRPNHAVVFEAGEPIAMISPLPRGDLERFRPRMLPIADDPEWHASYVEWSRSRSSFNSGLKAGDPEAVKAGWQRHYMLGVTIEDAEAPDHQTGLSLEAFQDKRPGGR